MEARTNLFELIEIELRNSQRKRRDSPITLSGREGALIATGRSSKIESGVKSKDEPSGQIAAQPRFTQEPQGIARSQRSFKLQVHRI